MGTSRSLILLIFIIKSITKKFQVPDLYSQVILPVPKLCMPLSFSAVLCVFEVTAFIGASVTVASIRVQKMNRSTENSWVSRKWQLSFRVL